ncbi:hypothetical protein FD755_000978 [Muntiacus reevesi]|uniref:Uncharacterized protein n=2 Tax=Muntiacus TaxID=9885 RepID=A0A5J5N160_MUNRE|nr:hypothetical protein FD754_009762 [Muntiacus muntjak]KAB0386022.1 hypothetical protein FD755_000978 [Muntiacus reevesi]
MPSPTNLATGIPSSKVKYSRLSSTFLIGAFLISIDSLLLADYITKGGAGVGGEVPILIIGILVFLPGF